MTTSTTNAKVQIRGNCQCCGRQQAFQRGVIAKHGYTVDNGYFNGVCQGHRFQPMQLDRTESDRIIAMVRADVAATTERADKLESGKSRPKLVNNPYERVVRGQEPTKVEFSSLPEWKQRDIIGVMVNNLRSHAKAGAAFADDLETVVNHLHGTKMVEVAVAAGPAPIELGEKRVDAKGTVFTCTGLDRGRVIYRYVRSDGTAGKSWQGAAAWRRLAFAA